MSPPKAVVLRLLHIGIMRTLKKEYECLVSTPRHSDFIGGIEYNLSIVIFTNCPDVSNYTLGNQYPKSYSMTTQINNIITAAFKIQIKNILYIHMILIRELVS